ncbi:hypothetical protein [Paracholeplasma manati]|uniref:SipW-cognate class signal peptide n=1 Tax=Paracholeplasma manati TaxID=591373 RepID=A0ABT2Y6G8_9MOLU|nr:hypothetical protein [Paracholeplasma manati]MCV2232325.1 hypothetical protein [Paracholeplasma manati]MDG0888282.1 hypothetical protein [Paracholeplasma manati]
MRKLTQKLVLSVVTMALVVIALGTSTFAWFTLTNKAAISPFEAQVTAGEGIEITLGDWNGTNAYTAPDADTVWYTVMPTNVIEDYIDNMYNNFRFDNMTSADGSVIRNEALSDISYSPAAKYIQFTLYFRSSAIKTIVWNSAELTGDPQPWVVNVPSFISSDGITPWLLNETKQVSAYTGARVSIEGTAGTYTFQAPEGTVLGVYNSNDDVVSYDLEDVGGVFTVGAGTGTPYGAAAYGVAAGKTTTYGAAAPTVHATSLINTTPAELLTLGSPADGYYYGNVIVRVWIEGFDADTFDAIFNSTLSVQLGFGVDE